MPYPGIAGTTGANNPMPDIHRIRRPFRRVVVAQDQQPARFQHPMALRHHLLEPGLFVQTPADHAIGDDHVERFVAIKPLMSVALPMVCLPGGP